MANGKYNNRAFVSNAPGAFYPIYASDFGAPAPAAATLVLETGSGTLTTGTAYVEITWITQEGVSLVSASASLATPTNTDAVNVTVTPISTVSTKNPVIGFQIYSSSTTAGVKLNKVSTSTSPAPTLISTNQGAVYGYAVTSAQTTATVLLEAVGTGNAPPSTDESGIQNAIAAVGSNTSVDYYAIVPNTGSQWKQQKSVDWMNSDGIPETLGIVLSHLDFIQPVYPGAAGEPVGGVNPPSSTYTQASVAPGTFMVMNGYLFEAVQASSASTAATTFIGFSAFNLAKGSQTTDGNVTWQSYGKAGLVRFQFNNVSGSPATPAQRAYELFQQ